MPRRKRACSPLFDPFDDDFDEDASSQSSKNGNPPVQRNAANARERARMRVLSSAFGRLKTKLPNIPPDTKLSKLDTLRLATMYIKQLKVLAEGGGGGGTTSAENRNILQETTAIFSMQGIPQSMTWPFGFHNMQPSSNNNSTSASRLQTSPPQYSSTEWNHAHNAFTKYGRSTCNSNGSSSHNSNTYNQDSNHLHSMHHWYTGGGPGVGDEQMAAEENNDNNNHHCAYFESQAHHQMLYNTGSSHANAQNTMR